MATHVSLFDQIVTKEDDFTRLLCNLMQRYEDFRSEILKLFLEDQVTTARILPAHLKTQIDLKGSGRPDIVIDSPDLYALLEVKLSESRALTACQEPVRLDTDDLKNYFTHVERQTARQKAILFLVPERWQFTKDLQEAFDKLKMQSSVITKVVWWLQILGVAQNLQVGRPGIEEFCLLLQQKIGPMTFVKTEIDMLFREDVPVRELMKLFFLVDRIAKRCEGRFGKIVRIAGPKFRQDGEQYGLEIYNAKKRHLLWFGLWSPFWKETGEPLSFGIDESSLENAKEAFLNTYDGPTKRFGSYTVGWVPKDDLLLDGTTGDAEEKVWNRIQPILVAIENAMSEHAEP